ncbi:MAG: hypothetical protein M3R70_00515 [Actinomycetota bacterium]|nr:hypothetical protein [Actinomycetota bacterium]
MGLWNWIRAIGGNRDEQTAERAELGEEDPGESEVRQWEDSSRYAGAEAADVVEGDLSEFEPPRDPSP